MDIVPFIIVLIIGIVAGLLVAAHSYEPAMKNLEDMVADRDREISKLKKKINH